MSNESDRRIRLVRTAGAALLTAVLGPLLAFAAVPQRINFQGRLVNPATKNPITDPSAGVTLRICAADSDCSTAPNKIWEESQTVNLSNGVFEAVLGNTVPISSAVFAGGPRWLEIKVENDVLSPRQPLVSAPSALRAAAAEYLEPGSTNYVQVGNSLQSGAAFYVSSATVAGNFIVGGALRVQGGLTLDGVLIAGSGANQLTSAAGLLDGSRVDPDPAKLIPSAAVDPSSVTKLSAAGLVPNTLLDTSSVTKAGNVYNAAGGLARLDASGTLNAGAAGASVYSITASSGIRMDAGTLTLAAGSRGVDAQGTGVVASTGYFTATGLGTQYGVTVSSGLQMSKGSLKLAGSAGIDASDTGIGAGTATLHATGSDQYGLYASSGIRLDAGTLTLSAGSRGLDAQGTGVLASTGVFTAVGSATQYGVSVSSGVRMSKGLLNLAGSAGLDAPDTGIAAATATFSQTGATQYSLHTSSGIQMGAGTLTLEADSRGLDAQGTGIVASTGYFTASGLATQYGLTVSSGIQMSKGLLDLDGSAGIEASDTGIVAATGTFGGIMFSSPTALITFTADNTLITVAQAAGRSYLRLTSNSGTAANRTFCLPAGGWGQLLILEWINNGTNTGELLDGSISGAGTCTAAGGAKVAQLSAVWPSGATAANDMIMLIYQGNNWMEIGRGSN